MLPPRLPDRYSDELSGLPATEDVDPLRHVGAGFASVAGPGSDVRAYRWNRGFVALCVPVPVDLPARGPVGVALRAVEPVLFLYRWRACLQQAPFVVLDRLRALENAPDWPRAGVALSRGGVDAVYREEGPAAVVQAVREWLRDVAAAIAHAGPAWSPRGHRISGTILRTHRDVVASVGEPESRRDGTGTAHVQATASAAPARIARPAERGIAVLGGSRLAAELRRALALSAEARDCLGALARHVHVVDASGSSVVRDALTGDETPSAVQHGARAVILDAGRLGLLFWEGAGRNPRIDDLEAHWIAVSARPPDAHTWSAAPGPAHVSQEAGAIDYHAAVFTMALKQAPAWRADGQGRIVVSRLSADASLGAMVTTLLVPSVHPVGVVGTPRWRVRMRVVAAETMRRCVAQAGRRATGGMLVGLLDARRRVIHVADVLPASRDSKGTRHAFVRGVRGYLPTLDMTRARDRRLGYVGEWYSRPGGRTELEDTDRHALREWRALLEGTGIPAHLMVCGAGLVSFVVDDVPDDGGEPCC